MPSSNDSNTAPPDRFIGPYLLCERIGEGGFGDVWRAELTEVVKREVALKVIKAGMDTAQVMARFEQEHQTLARLQHPNIATLLNAGVSAEGRPYFAMELVRGGPVTRWCETHDATLSERLQLFLQVCRAVQHAHEHGILHRDLKPNNILISETGGQVLPKVIDFGLALAINASPLDRLTRLTQGDQVVGTPMYMSPEQIEGRRELNPCSDVYALGVLLYELLTGLVPFETTSQGAAGVEAVKQMILETVPERPSTRVRNRTTTHRRTVATKLAGDLDWITLRALEKDPSRRYASAAELAADVERHLGGERVLARPPSLAYATGRWLKRHRTACIAATAGAALGAALLGPPLLLHRPANPLPGPPELASSGFFTNHLGMQFVPLPGTDLMMCIHETRRQDFAAYADEVPQADPRWKRMGFSTYQGGVRPVGDQDDHPVIGVNLDDARSFCTWLSAREGRTYRVPTDAEWSLAVGLSEAREPDTTPAQLSDKDSTHFPWGEDFPPSEAARSGNYADEVAHDQYPDLPFLEGFSDGFVTTAPVMSFRPNAIGLYDMGGNAAELCADWFDASHKRRVVRGGSFTSSTREDLLSSHRSPRDPALRYANTGFRCVLEKHPPAARAVFVPPARSTQPAYRNPPPPVAKFPEPLPPKEVARQTVTNSLGMKFVPVPKCPVLVCIHETRRQDYAAFAREVPPEEAGSAWRTAATKDGLPCGTGDDHPVCAVTWEQAHAFCAWLSRKEGRRYRVPRDWEWSIAVGLGEVEEANNRMTPQQKGTIGRAEYPFGNTFPPKTSQRAGNYADATLHARTADAAWIKDYDDSQLTTAPVMSFAANPFGLYDMGGNVSEWVEEAVNAIGAERVLRGGSWRDAEARVLASAWRSSAKPSTTDPTMGFRVVLEVNEVTPVAK